MKLKIVTNYLEALAKHVLHFDKIITIIYILLQVEISRIM